MTSSCFCISCLKMELFFTYASEEDGGIGGGCEISTSLNSFSKLKSSSIITKIQKVNKQSRTFYEVPMELLQYDQIQQTND